MHTLLKELGIGKQELISTALELFVPHPGVESREKARGVLNELLDRYLRDPNVACLLIAAFELDKSAERGEIPGISREAFKNDEVFVVADEIIGMAIAEYIGGTRALFEFVRFDREKPGILSRLKPFSDDAIAGLLAGVSSQMYSQAGGFGAGKPEE